jgi:hypothetical protein
MTSFWGACFFDFFVNIFFNSLSDLYYTLDNSMIFCEEIFENLFSFSRYIYQNINNGFPKKTICPSYMVQPMMLGCGHLLINYVHEQSFPNFVFFWLPLVFPVIATENYQMVILSQCLCEPISHLIIDFPFFLYINIVNTSVPCTNQPKVDFPLLKGWAYLRDILLD